MELLLVNLITAAFGVALVDALLLVFIDYYVFVLFSVRMEYKCKDYVRLRCANQ